MSLHKTRHLRRARRTNERARLALLNLESRLAPANITVLNADESGAGSLRQAILDTNGMAGPDTIDFDPTFFATPQIITLFGASGQLDITDDLVITGPGAARLTISGNNETRIFNVDNAATATINVTISGMTVTGGNGSTGGGTPVSADGGGIRTTNEILTLENMVITGNVTTGSNDGGGFTATSSAFVTFRNSTISGNTTDGSGGGIYFFSGGGMLIENSTISGNTANEAPGGGGIYFFGTVAAGGVTVRNSTFSGNTATGPGGGIVLRTLTGNVLIQNSTITNNSSGSTAVTAGLGGGGISIATGSANSMLTLQSTIVSGNTSDQANGRDDIAVIDAATVNAVNSAIGDADGFTLSASSANNLAPGANLDLQTLGDNGGPTQTIALGAASLAIGAGVNPFPSKITDQRGAAFVRSVGPTDIGAFEVPAAAGTPTASGTFPLLGTPGNATYTFSIAYADNGSINAGSLGNNDVRVTGPNGYNQLATFGTLAAGVATYSITAPGATFVNADNGVYTIAIEPGAVTDNLGNAVPGGANGQFLIDLPGTYTVTNLNDAGTGSLRQALLNANFSATVDTVAFQTGLTGTITLTSGQLVVSNPVSIVGPGAAALTVSGGNTSRVFNVENANSVITVSISGLTVTSGNGSTGGAAPVAGDGGGIRTTNEILTLDGVIVTGNATTGTNDGGGLAATTTAFVTIRNSTISGNTTGGSGGGIYFLSGAGTLIENSTISGNTSTDAIGGGGIYFFGTVPASGFTIRNSTIAGNSATASGGGIVLRALNTVNAPILIQNSTITNNFSAATATTVGVGGGGIAMPTVSTAAGATAIVTIQSTIVSGNTADAANGRSDIATVAAGVVNVYNSAIGDADGFTIAGSGANLPIGAALNLQPLASYGGSTATVALGSGSMALNAGINTTPTLVFDQRGTGFPRQVGAAVDIGAFEGVVDLPVGTSSFTSVTTGGATSYPFSVTYTSGSPINLSTLDNNDIRITGPGGFNVLATRGTIDSTNPLSVIVAYSFTPPMGTFDTADNGLYTVTLQAGQVANSIGASNAVAQLGTIQVAIPGVFTVTNLNDDGPGSLRQAILDANAGPTLDIINFQAGLTGTITLTSGQITISERLVLNGPGATALTISGGGASRIFNVENAGGVIDVTISGLTVSGGNGTNGGATPVSTDGGGIRTTDEILTLENMIITGNSNADDVTDGGGVSATSVAFITIRNSTISGNTAGKNGGGMYFFSGGGLLMENSTVSGNVAPGVNGGGGIYFFGTVAAGGFAIRNSTIAGNSATVSSGGGIVLRSLTGTIAIQNSTIANNSSGTASTTDGLGGGGIALATGGVNSILTLQSTIVSGNTSDAGNGRDDIAAIPAATVNAYNSAIGDGDGFTLTGNTDNLPIGSVLNLQALGNNGGLTQTIELGAASLAIDAGANTTPTLMFDQRGAGFARNDGVDIGAFEVQGASPAPTVTLARVNASASSQRSRVTSLEVTFSTQVAFAGAVANAFTITRTGGGPVGGFTATANVVGGVTVVTLSGFTGAETESGSLRDGRYTLTVLANQVSAGGQQMAANFVFGGATVADNFYRFYGDVAGLDRRVDISDFGFFSLAYLTPTNYNAALDFNNDGRIDIADFGQFSVRYFTTLP